MPEKNGKQPYMYRREFVAALAGRTGLSEADAARFTEEFLGLLLDTWCSQRSVCFQNFGVFELRTISEKIMGRNPRTMEAHPAQAGYKPVFKPNKEMRKYITQRIQSIHDN